MRNRLRMAMAAASLLLVTSPALAQRLELSVTPSVISFPAADPDAMPVISSAPVQVSYRVRQSNGPWTLTVLAGGDLNSGSASVDISNVTWVATPAPPFTNGTLSKTVAQTLASGVDDVNPRRTGSVTFRIVNSWTYIAGTYTQLLTFTLSAP